MNMNLLTIVPIIIFISIITFGVLVKLLTNVPKKYHKSIQLMGSLGIIIIISGTFITYYNDQNEKIYKEKLQYSDTILQSFEKVDDFLIKNYDTCSVILGIIYNKIQLPSSKDNIRDKLLKIDKKTKDILFIVYNRLTIIFEKMYLINPTLFDNDKIGIRVRLYVENIFYYEYWNSAKQIYNSKFVMFMDDKYKFLSIIDPKYIKNDIETYRIPYADDIEFMFESPSEEERWF
jgi:hypothetical protein